MLTMEQITTQIEQVCELCSSKHCADCKINIKLVGKNVVVNGSTRKIESVEKIPIFA